MNGRVAVITGSASGLGRAIAVRLAEEGAHVVVSDVRPDPREGGDLTEAVIERAGGSCVRIDADASRWEASTAEEDWDAIVAVNLRGVFLCCKRAIGEMLEQEPLGEIRGRVINISSQHGMVGSPGHVAYSTSTGGVINLTHQLAVHYGRHGVLVNAVAPGKILTGSPEQVNEEAIADSHVRTPFFRLGQPSDVAAAAAFLASDDAVYISGTNLLVDGGWMAY